MPTSPAEAKFFNSLTAGLLLLVSVAPAADAPKSGRHDPVLVMPVRSLLDATADELKPGQFLWQPDASTSGPVLIVVSIPEQRAYVYRNGVAIGISTVSTGRKGHETPTGVFTILQKEERHFSSTYNNAPMPYMERLTWDGIALHAGNLPGYPASHGCVRLPKEFAKLLYGVTQKVLSVVIADDQHSSQALVHPGLLAPVSPDAKAEQDLAPLPERGFTWKPDKASSGPLSVLLSRTDRVMYVYRGGTEIGCAKVSIANPTQQLGYAVYNMLEGFSQDPSPIAPDLRSHRWMRVHLKSGGPDAATSTVASRVRMPPTFSKALYAALEPGATLLVPDLSANRRAKTKPGFVVMSGDGD